MSQQVEPGSEAMRRADRANGEGGGEGSRDPRDAGVEADAVVGVVDVGDASNVGGVGGAAGGPFEDAAVAPGQATGDVRSLAGVCVVCGNLYDKSFEVRPAGGEPLVFDSFECAIARLAPRCGHCDCMVIGHGVEVDGRIYCCAHCARAAEPTDAPTDRVELQGGPES